MENVRHKKIPTFRHKSLCSTLIPRAGSLLDMAKKFELFKIDAYNVNYSEAGYKASAVKNVNLKEGLRSN